MFLQAPEFSQDAMAGVYRLVAEYSLSQKAFKMENLSLTTFPFVMKKATFFFEYHQLWALPFLHTTIIVAARAIAMSLLLWLFILAYDSVLTWLNQSQARITSEFGADKV